MKTGGRSAQEEMEGGGWKIEWRGRWEKLEEEERKSSVFVVIRRNEGEREGERMERAKERGRRGREGKNK